MTAPPESTAFVTQAMRHLGTFGYDGANTDFARALGLGMHGPGRVGRWLKGTSAPDYEATLMIATACGWFSMTGAEAEDAPSSRDPLAELATAVVAIAETQQEILRRLPEPTAARASPRRVDPKRS